MTIPFPVLIVEDGDAGATRFERLLQAHGLLPDLLDTAGCVQEAIGCVLRRRYRLALVAMRLPDGDGAAAIRGMLAIQPDLHPIVVASQGNAETVLKAVRAGAQGYLLKDSDDDDLARSLACIEHGGAPVSPAIAQTLLTWVRGGAQARRTPPPAPPEAQTASAIHPIALTPREHDVLFMISEGCTNKEAAQRLGLSVHTVDFHAKKAYAKLSARSRTQAVTRARDHGLIT